MAFLHINQLFRCAFKYYPPSTITTFRAEIDDMISDFDHVEIVLDNQHRITSVNKFVQYIQQVLNILEMQSGSRFIENIKSFTGVFFSKLC